MQQSSREGIRLPKELLAQLDVHVSPRKHARGDGGSFSRKAQRKAARVEKKTKAARVSHKLHVRNSIPHEPSLVQSSTRRESASRNDAPLNVKQKSTNETAQKSAAPPSHSEGASVVPSAESREIRLNAKTKIQLEEDDAEIAALEKKLGIGRKKSLPQAFTDDGLVDLLDGLENGASNDTNASPEREFDQEWLRKKREHPRGVEPLSEESPSSDFSGFDDSESDRSHGSKDRYDDEMIEAQPSGSQSHLPNTMPGARLLEAKPSLHKIGRNENGSQDDADTVQLKKLARRCVNRLSEANFVATIADAERLYQDHPRRIASEALLEATFDHLNGRDSLSDSFLILYSGFLTAMFKGIGPEFGVETVRRVTEAAERSLDQESQVNISANLLTTLTQLFNFRVISSELVYDFVRMFVTKISERNTQLLLRIMKACGPQLRQEDPSSLKDIVVHLQSAVAKVPPENLSVRTKFMIEMITDLKNNKIKSSANSASIAQEQVHRMKMLVASMGQNHTHTTEPLRITLSDLHDDTKTGQWWSSGARHRKPANSTELGERNVHRDGSDDVQDMQTLASAQRMNTDVRRSIFVSLVSASDGKDAHSRILSLNLKKSQDLEIPKVLIHCLVAEQHYNPYYTFVANQLCAERRMRISFQITLWNTLREAESEDGGDEAPGSQSLRSIVHLAKMFGELVAHQRLDLKGLKNLEFAIVSARMHAFLEIFFLTILLQTRRQRKQQQGDLREIFQPLCDTPEVARAVRFFIRSTVHRSDVIATDSERERVQRGCEAVDGILQGA